MFSKFSMNLSAILFAKEGPLSHGLKTHVNVLISKSKSSMLNNNLKAKKCEWK